MELNEIKKTGSWGSAATSINENNQKINTEVTKLKYATNKCKGLHATGDSLKLAFPSPLDGDWAIVGKTVPGPIWSATGGIWTSTGESGGVGGIDATGYATVEQMNAVQKTADDAKTLANSANSKADSANSNASSALVKANEANTNASDAKELATKAQQSATQAGSNATSALDKASEALLIADSLAKSIPLINVNALCGSKIYTLQTARSAITEKSVADGTEYRNVGSVITYQVNTDTWEIKQFVGDLIDKWEEDDKWSDFSGTGTGSGSGFYNVTLLHPLTSDYYTKDTAVAALSSAEIKDEDKPGMIITFEVSAGKWEDYRFSGTSIDTFLTPAAWETFGGGDAIKEISVNGSAVQKDETGRVNITINEIEVDESLDANSTNPVQNSAVTAKLNEIDANTIFGGNAELSEDESTVRLTLTNKSGAEVVAVDIPAGSGGGGGETSTTKIVLSASLDKTTVKEGGDVGLTYTYDHQYASGDDKGTSTGQKATVTIEVKRGATTTYSNTINEVIKGTYTLDLTKYLLVGTSDVYVRATTTDPGTGKQQTKQSYVSVKVVTISLSSSYNLSSGLTSGGYGNETVSIPYSVNGIGTKVVTLYVDGAQRNAHTVTRSGTTNGSFDLSMTGLPAGRHTVQLVAEMEADGLVLKSESIYIDFLKSGSNTPFVGLMFIHPDGRIFTDTHLTPTIEVGQYERCEFKFVGYNPAGTPASVEILRNDTLISIVSVPRTTQIYTNRFTDRGTNRMRFKCGTFVSDFFIDVINSDIDISEATYGLLAKFSPAGRSNEESNPAQWESNGITTTFENFDWSSNGWTGDSLKLTNGAKAIINHPLFASDAGVNGATIEMEFKVTNVTDRSAEVISCMDDGKGLNITTDEASIKTGVILHYTNEDGEDASREIKIGTKFASDKWLKVAFVISKRTEGRLMELYVNGNRGGADIYDNGYYFQQDNPAYITLSSEMADLEVKNIRIYNRSLSDDEVLDNRMVDCDSSEDMMRLYEDNDILGYTGDVDIDKLRSKGKGVMRIVRLGGLDELNQTNDKSKDFIADIYFYSPFGKEFDFILRDCYIRIQGTSSTKYPSKNIRIYMSKGGANLSLTVNGELVADKKYKMRANSIPLNLYCMKSDYSDSSMTANTGVAKLYNDVMIDLGLLTPPQRHQYEQSGSLNDITVRQSIDGFPIDIFSAETIDGENTYFGQFNYNNEKSKSGPLFGQEGVTGFTPSLPLTLETLNNTAKTCLFQSSSDEDFAANFDAGLEVNYPDDVKWAGLNDTQRAALKRLFAWIRSCVPSGANSDNLSSFVSQKFKDEISQYFDKDHLLMYYINSDYDASVDQRAKNMLLRTWDGLIWYITYYDGDSQFGKRNDCFLAYDYTIDRDTYDAEAGKYAFEGRDSWLWNLVLANLQDDLKRCANNYRSKMTVDRVLSMLNVEQMGNWSDRAYNKSGYLKYIRPAMVDTYGKKWPFIYALQGSNEAHRTYFIKNRFALLDAKYGTSSFTSDNIDLYMARTLADVADTVKITANEVYAFGYGTNNSPNIANTGMVEGGEEASLNITGAYTVNDPLRIYGASRMRILDMTGAANRLKNAFDLGKCTVLRELNLESTSIGSTGWWLNIGSCKQLRKINLKNQKQAKTGSSTSTELDLSNQNKLIELDARGTGIQSVTFCPGAPLTTVQLPDTIKVLKLTYLTKLTDTGLTLEGYSNLRTLVVDGCPGINWENLLVLGSGIERIRITGINKEDDGTWLNRFKTMKGIDASGNAVDTCSLVGTVRLTTYIADSEYEAAKSHFPELNIIQPEYTMIEFDDNISDEYNISNLDNRTGNKYNNAYSPSAHILSIQKARHRVLCKMTGEKESTIYPLHDANSNYYADATSINSASTAKLDGTEGDVMMFEPHYWYKGVNDALNGKKYACFSFNKYRPSTPDCTILRYEDITDIRDGYRLSSAASSIRDALKADTTCQVLKIPVTGYKRVRYPSAVGGLICALFVDSADVIVKDIVSEGPLGLIDGMYIISDVPQNASGLYFTIRKGIDFDPVVLSNSDKIEDMEPDWAEHEECLVGVHEASYIGSKLVSIASMTYSTENISQGEFSYSAKRRNMQLIDWNMHKDIANRFFAFYGRRDSQDQCGYGSNTTTRIMGETAKLGMRDTINQNHATSGAWYVETDEWGIETIKSIGCNNCMGYENLFGGKAEWLGNVSLPNDPVSEQYKIYIEMPDGTTRKVKTSAVGGYMTKVFHQKFMDVSGVSSSIGTSTTYYCDEFIPSGTMGRVIFRSSSNAYPQGGVSYANCGRDSSDTLTHIGSRLAFRGKIVVAASVQAFKALVGIS